MFDFNRYTEASELNQVFQAFRDSEKVQLIAGGTDVLVKSRERYENFIDCDLVGVTRIPELHGIELDKEGTLCIGSASTFTAVEKNELVRQFAPALAQAAGTVGGPQTRNVGTIGGNVCNGATSGDSGATLFAYNAILELHSAEGIRNVDIKEFYLGPGRVALERGEVLVKIRIRKEDYEGFAGHYTKFAQRKALDIANLSCCVLVKEDDNRINDIRIAYGVAGPVPIRATPAEDFAKGMEISEENLKKISEKCLESSRARDSWRASKEYREHLIRLLFERGVMTAIGGKSR